MIKGIFKDSGVLWKLLQLIAVFSFVLIATLLVTVLVTTNDMNDMSNVKLMQLIQSIGLFIIPPFVMASLWSNNAFEFLRLKSTLRWTTVLYVVAFMLVAIPFINMLSWLNQQIILPEALSEIEKMMQSSEVQIAEITEKMLNVSTLGALLFNVFLVAVVPALGEELFFRGTIQRLLSDWKGALFAIWITAFVFSAIHMQFYGFLPRMLLGAFLGYLLLWSGSLWLPIIAHFVNNSVAVVFYYLKFNGVKVIDVETIGTDDTLWLGIVSGIVCVFLGFLIRKNTRKATSEIQL
ncbi:MAG: CPBP family intramembrane glutamic endopeptidase [Paludibacter sp.]|nr:CPBP family intramembrane glutamic endopeptidase [Paludibacter sp.]